MAESEREEIAKELSDAYAERSEMVSERDAAKRDAARRIQNYQEILRSGPKDIDELVDVVNNLSYRDVRRTELGQKYGRGWISSVRAFLAGEFDVGIGENDEVRRGGWNRVVEVGRRALMTVFNRRTAAATGTAAVLGVLTGGFGAAAFGAAAFGVIFGSVAGRGTAEAIATICGRETGAREDILRAERQRWYELKNMAQELANTEDQDRKAEIMKQMTDLYFRQGESALLEKIQLAEDRLLTQQEALNKSRARWQLAGEIVGLGSGVAYSFLTGHFAAIDIDLWNKVKGQTIAHEVIKLNGQWHFIYHQSEVAAGLAGEAGKQVVAQGAQAAHLLGEPAWKIAAATIVERGVPVLMSAWAASVFGSRAEKRTVSEDKEYQSQMTRVQKRIVEEKIPKPKTPEEKIEDLKKFAEEQEKIYPEVGQIWESATEGRPSKYRIREIQGSLAVIEPAVNIQSLPEELRGIEKLVVPIRKILETDTLVG